MLSVLVLTHNEEIHIQRLLDSVAQLRVDHDVWIVDSGSTDNTRELARHRGAHVVTHEFEFQAKQLQWALAELPLREWVLRLDADEVIGSDLAEEISMRLETVNEDVIGFTLNRRHVFMDKWVKRGGRFPLRILRLWRRGAVDVEQRLMDEHMAVPSEGHVEDLNGYFADHNLKGIGFLIEKHNAYALREAADTVAARHGLVPESARQEPTHLDRHAKRRRWLKERVFNKMGYLAGPAWYLLWRLVWKGGLFDGKSGVAYHILQGFWYRLLAGLKVQELSSALDGCRTATEKIDLLHALTGIRFMITGTAADATPRTRE